MCSTKAAALGDARSAVLVGGGQVAPLAAEAGQARRRHGVSPPVDAFASPLPRPRVDVIAELVRTGGFDTVLFSNSVLAADVAAGLAARLDAGLNWDLVDLEIKRGELVGQAAVLAGLGARRRRLALAAADSRCSARFLRRPCRPAGRAAGRDR